MLEGHDLEKLLGDLELDGFDHVNRNHVFNLQKRNIDNMSHRDF